MRIFLKGEFVKVTLGGRTVRAVVMLASGNGRSLMLQFDAMVGGYPGMMPVMCANDELGFVDLFEQRPVRIEAA
jgi:hypothetical protein